MFRTTQEKKQINKSSFVWLGDDNLVGGFNPFENPFEKY